MESHRAKNINALRAQVTDKYIEKKRRWNYISCEICCSCHKKSIPIVTVKTRCNAKWREIEPSEQHTIKCWNSLVIKITQDVVPKFKQDAMDLGVETARRWDSVSSWQRRVSWFVALRLYCCMSQLHRTFQILKLFAKLRVHVYFFQGEASRAFIRFSQFSLKLLWITEWKGDRVSKLQHLLKE